MCVGTEMTESKFECFAGVKKWAILAWGSNFSCCKSMASCFVIFPYKLSGGGPRENLAHQAGETVWKRNQDGILVWDVDLVKRWGPWKGKALRSPKNIKENCDGVITLYIYAHSLLTITICIVTCSPCGLSMYNSTESRKLNEFITLLGIICSLICCCYKKL